MKIDWDEKKNRTNIKKHGFDFADAEEVFDGPMYIAPDTREDYGEDRWIGIGDFRGRIVVIAFAESSDDTIRIISMRKALKHERKYYEETIENEFGTD
ncbi:MAG: BrnT family toxin [Acidobacteria bacterium]|nr:BrnT family toxin [Acidobacteriota bacterium]